MPGPSPPSCPARRSTSSRPRLISPCSSGPKPSTPPWCSSSPACDAISWPSSRPIARHLRITTRSGRAGGSGPVRRSLSADGHEWPSYSREERLMAGLLRGGLATGLLVLCLTAPAQGFGFRWRSAYSHSYYSHSYYAPTYYAPRMSYYYPATYYSPQPAYHYAYPYQCSPVMPAGHHPSLGFQPYAQPRPAPASTQEPPTDRPGRSPKITESRYAGESGTDKQSPPSRDYCKVGFWNLTGRDVSLLVDGQA